MLYIMVREKGGEEEGGEGGGKEGVVERGGMRGATHAIHVHKSA